MKKSFQCIGLIARSFGRERAIPLLLDLAEYLTASGLSVLIERDSIPAHLTVGYTLVDREALGETTDLVIVVGGDGTMLSVARLLALNAVPLMGINQGRLGFMTDIPADEMIVAVDAILKGDFTVEPRRFITASAYRGEKQMTQAIALNDIVFSRGGMGQMIEFEVFIDEQFICTQSSDGLIVATPTGSTAYSLAAGGPILHPTLPALALVPVCPHSMSNRPIVVNDCALIEFVLTRGADTRVHFDGQSHADLLPLDRVMIRRYDHTLQLIHPGGYRYYDTLRRKLHWGKRLMSD